MRRGYKGVLGVLVGIALSSALFAIIKLQAPATTESSALTQLGDAALADETQSSDWLAYGRTHNERRFSPLTEINLGNVQELGVDWYIDLPNDRGLLSTPLVINGVLYFIGTMNIVRAVDASNGKILWEFDPKVAKAIGGNRHVGWSDSRGISFYEGKIFLATWDGRLISLDAETGAQIWSTRTFDLKEALYISGAPKAFKGKVLIGNGGTEHGPTRGFITAYDANTGEEAWKFYIVPGNPADGFENDAMELAASTWTGEWWKHGGGGNVWNGYTYDAELDVLYVGTGNGSPWNRKIRSPGGGDNLFLSSIIALNPDTGEYLWHYQTTPGESWDYNSNMDIVLADLEIEGEIIKAILHAPKNGFFYVINRQTGKLVSAEPFVETTWASHIDLATGRPVENPEARYEDGPGLVAPTGMGAHTWHAMSYNPETGLVYLPSIHLANIYTDENYDLKNWQSEDFLGGVGVDLLDVEEQLSSFPGSLQAWDPVKNERVWQVPQNTPANAGTLTTAGNLVFQGRPDGKFIGYNASTGEIVWSFDTGLGISAPPITYSVHGRQYIALLVGFGGGYSGLAGEQGRNLGWAYGFHPRRLITFSLQGETNIPSPPPRHYSTPIAAPDFEVDEGLASLGEEQWNIRCFECHGPGAIAAGKAPDLRASAVPLSLQAFTNVVREGAALRMGMPAYPEITDKQLLGLTHYIRQRANESHTAQSPPH